MDYDVDAVSLACYKVSKDGKIALWSPFARRNSLKEISDSMKITMPSGNAVTIIPANGAYSQANLDNFSERIANLLTTFFDITTAEGKYLNDVNLLNTLISIEQLPELTTLLAVEVCKKLNLDIQSASLITRIYQKMIDDIDRHNLYLNTITRSELKDVTTNYIQHYLYEVIADPINLTQAQSSVDKMTEPLKELGNSQPGADRNTTRAPGDFTAKAYSINENQIGKDGIGICANAMRIYFGLCTSINNILLNGTDELKSRTKFSININGKTYTDLANINAPGIFIETFNSIINPSEFSENVLTQLTDLQQRLLKSRNLEDLALILSAMLSLATDNAKELQLSKLNAGLNTLGLYLYGISIGMPATDVANLLTSNTGKTLTDLLASNLFTNEEGLFDFSAAFDYIKLGPDVSYFEKKSGNQLTKLVANKLKAITGLKSSNLSYLIAVLVQAIKAGKITFYHETTATLNLVNILDTVINSINTNSQQDKWLKNQLKTFILDYAKMVLSLDNDTLNDLLTLYEGSQEFRAIGSVYNLNRELPTSQNEILAKVNTVMNCISSREKIINRRDRRDFITKEFTRILNEYFGTGKTDKLSKFYGMLETPLHISKLLYDEDERNNYIHYYDNIKHTVNIVEAALTVPHFTQYLKLLDLLHTSLSTISHRYRYIYNMGRLLLDLWGISDSSGKDAINRGLSSLYSDYVRKQWMLDSQLTIELPKGTMRYVNGQLYPIKSKDFIHLGTTDGDATFKYFMENVVIPQLKKEPQILGNKFIQDLRLLILSNTVTGNAIIYYTLPINMLPSTDLERVIFNDYKAQFNAISTIEYKVGDKSYALRDLFYYYGLIAHYGKQGLLSLMPIFENQHKFGALYDFHQYESHFDKVIDVSDDVLESYCLPIGNLWSSRNKYIKAYDTETMLMSRWEYDPFRNYEDATYVGNYRLTSSFGVRSNDYLYPKNEVDDIKFKLSETLEQTLDTGKYKVSFKNGKIKKVEGVKSIKGMNKELPNIINQAGEININYLNNMIDHILNCS